MRGVWRRAATPPHRVRPIDVTLPPGDNPWEGPRQAGGIMPPKWPGSTPSSLWQKNWRKFLSRGRSDPRFTMHPVQLLCSRGSGLATAS